ncbi:MAG: DUF2127 domain-containing protein [Actinomycetota bacterium]
MERARGDLARYGVAGFKLVTAAAEGFAATVLLAFSSGHIERTTRRLLSSELNHDPNDVIARFISNHIHGVASDKTILGLTLAVVAAFKIVGAIGLLLHKPWGYYLLVVLVVGAIPIDVYHLFHHHTWTSAILLAVNLLLLAILVRFRHFLLARETRAAPEGMIETAKR